MRHIAITSRDIAKTDLLGAVQADKISKNTTYRQMLNCWIVFDVYRARALATKQMLLFVANLSEIKAADLLSATWSLKADPIVAVMQWSHPYSLFPEQGLAPLLADFRRIASAAAAYVDMNQGDGQSILADFCSWRTKVGAVKLKGALSFADLPWP